MSTLYVAFKGNGNSSNKIVRSLSGDKLFLTNSYNGLKKDIDDINTTYDLVYMFGLDKKLNKSGIDTIIGNIPIQSLCNEAYWHMLKKFNCHVLFFHIPSIKYITDNFIKKIEVALGENYDTP